MTKARGHTVHLVALIAVLAASGIAAVLVLRAAALAAGRDVLATGRPAAEALVMVVVALMLLAVVGFRPETLRNGALRRTATASTLVLVVGIGGLWQVIFRESELDALHGTRVSSAAEADDFLAAHPPPAPTVYQVPTGLFLQQYEFLSGDNVRVAGYVWQRYADAVPAEIERTIIFPESIATDVFDEAYREDVGNGELIGWYFEVTLRQAFDYTRYPLDRQDVWIRMWSPSADRGSGSSPTSRRTRTSPRHRCRGSRSRW